MEIVKDINKLKEVSQPVPEGEYISDFLIEMQKVLIETRAVGLSAIQLGKPWRLFTIQTGFKKFEIFRNPILSDLQERFIFPNEMCLSFPGEKVNTVRYSKCFIKDEFHPDGMNCEGIMAVAVQHEMDHLDGLVMADREFKFVNVGRNDPCPCKSGKKFKKCCEGKL